MNSFMMLVLVTLLAFVAFSTVEAGPGPNKLQRDVPDAFKAFAISDYSIAISDIDNDQRLECLTVMRKDLDPEAKTVTYIWSINQGPGQKRKHYAFHYTQGDSPDTAYFTVGNDTKVEVKRVRYSDYKNCVITESSHFLEECTLWVPKDVVNQVPQNCIEQFADICGEAVNLRSNNICEDDYTDTEDGDI
ncbi:uncharacterized protein LOC144165115 [Haemaphysalis longicornis]